MPLASTHDVPVVPWGDFLAGTFDWRQGEHVALVGPTGQGKSTLSQAIMGLRRWVVVIATKPKDGTTDRLRRRGYVLLRAWPPSPDQLARGSRFILWPKLRNVADQANQATVVNDALRSIFADGSWCVVLDEQEYVTDDLGARDMVRLLYKQGRSLGISLLCGNQRPRWVPRETWTQATHLFLWGTSDRDDLRALAGLGVANSDAIKHTVANLARYDALYVNTRTGALAVTRAPKE